MDVFEALYTTRAMRRVKPDPIPEYVQAIILDAAVRAPTGGNAQEWRFLFVDSPQVKARIAPLYRECLAELFDKLYSKSLARAEAEPERPENERLLKMFASARHLADNFETYPLLMLAFVRFDPTGGSIYPAVWSAMLAARAEGVGTTLTTALLAKADQLKTVLEIPDDWMFSCCVTFGYPTGRWDVAPRKPAHTVAFHNAWGNATAFEIPVPLWRA